MIKEVPDATLLQIENEFGSYGHEDTDYLRDLVRMIRGYGINELILTADRAQHLRDGAVPGAVATVTCHGTADDVTAALSSLSNFQPDLPRLVTLLDVNGTSRWGESTYHSTSSVAHFRRSLDLILSSNASINIYAFAGGTNFGFWSGAVEDTGIDSSYVNIVRQAVRRRGRHHHRRARQHRSVDMVMVNHSVETAVDTTGLLYRPATTSYNYSPPPIISQSGHSQFSLKYHALRRLLLDRGLISRLQTVPVNPSTSGIGMVRLDHQLNWQNILNLIPGSPIFLDAPVFMEQLNTQLGSGQVHGWIVYRTRLPSATGNVNISGTMRDRAQVYLNGHHVQTVYNHKMSAFSVIIPTLHNNKHVSQSPSVTSTLELIVENMGRSSFGLLDDQRKGFEGAVSVHGKIVDSHWEHFSLDFSPAFLTAIKQSKDWLPTVRSLTTPQGHGQGHGQGQGQPTLYRGHFRIKQFKDTYIDMSKWTKGLVIVNGFVLGRYWNIGPQQSLYVPSPILSHGLNEILVFELERTLNAKVKFVAKSLWDNHKHRG